MAVGTEPADFLSLLTAITLHPRRLNTSPATQRFALALAGEWVENAATELASRSRRDRPSTVNVTIDGWPGQLSPTDELDDLASLYTTHVDRQVEREMRSVTSLHAVFGLVGSVTLLVVVAALLGPVGWLMLPAGASVIATTMLVRSRRSVPNRRRSLKQHGEARKKEGLAVRWMRRRPRRASCSSCGRRNSLRRNGSSSSCAAGPGQATVLISGPCGPRRQACPGRFPFSPTPATPPPRRASTARLGPGAVRVVQSPGRTSRRRPPRTDASARAGGDRHGTMRIDGRTAGERKPGHSAPDAPTVRRSSRLSTLWLGPSGSCVDEPDLARVLVPAQLLPATRRSAPRR